MLCTHAFFVCRIVEIVVNTGKGRIGPCVKNLLLGENIINEPLLDRDSIILPTLHIKLGLIKHFVKVFYKKGAFFEYI